MTFGERLWVVIGFCVLGVLMFVFFLANEAHINEEVAALNVPRPTTTTTAPPDRVGPLEVELAAVKQQVEELVAHHALNAQEVRALLDRFLPVPDLPPEEDVACEEPPCPSLRSTTTVPVTTTEKRRD